jgi:hypothetical protein
MASSERIIPRRFRIISTSLQSFHEKRHHVAMMPRAKEIFRHGSATNSAASSPPQARIL